MWEENLWHYLQGETYALLDWAKCGDSIFSLLPTVLWAAGAAALAHRLLASLFRRFLFRRIPVWELILQQLLFLWMVIYSLHFWVLLVRIVKVIVDYCYEDERWAQVYDGRKMTQQWIIWMFGAVPLAMYIHTRPRTEHPPLMIWITTNPWQRREMGPYGYYLNRPLSSLQSSDNISIRQQILCARRAFSDSKIVVKQPTIKKKHTKSV